MRIKKNIAISENGFIFNPATGDSFSVNAIAAKILTAIRDGQNEADIKAGIISEYEVSIAQLDRDWDDYVAQLREANLLETE